MTGYIGLVMAETARYSQFHADMHRLLLPEGVEVISTTGPSDSSLSMCRNEIVETFLKDPDAQWLLMVDDDHSVDGRFLVDFLQRRRQRGAYEPILSTLYLTKKAPFQPTLYGPQDADGLFPNLFLEDLPTSGVASVYASGASCQLVQREVYTALGPPWYRLGQSDHVGEDLWFCHRAQQAGFPVTVDLDARIGHVAPFTIWPMVYEGKWVTSIRRDTLSIMLDAAVSDEAVLA